MSGKRKKSVAGSPKSEEEIEKPPAAECFAPTVQTANSKLQTEEMEVHHHPDLHHEKKPWKEYILEYIMIFLAVTTGFFAESLREHMADNSKEHEFIVSMIEDARTDTANINKSMASNLKRAMRLD